MANPAQMNTLYHTMEIKHFFFFIKMNLNSGKMLKPMLNATLKPWEMHCNQGRVEKKIEEREEKGSEKKEHNNHCRTWDIKCNSDRCFRLFFLFHFYFPFLVPLTLTRWIGFLRLFKLFICSCVHSNRFIIFFFFHFYFSSSIAKIWMTRNIIFSFWWILFLFFCFFVINFALCYEHTKWKKNEILTG